MTEIAETPTAAEARAIAELRRQADAYGAGPYVDEDAGEEGQVLIDGCIDLPALVASVGIPWQPIATMPEDRKDGRPMLLWDSKGPVAAEWWADEKLWYMLDRQPHYCRRSEVLHPTHWADINPPE